MIINKPELVSFNSIKSVPLTVTHPYHMVPSFQDLANRGKMISEMGNIIGSDMVTRSGTFQDSMLGALDKVSSLEQLASNMVQDAIINPDMYDAHDITIAQAEASMALNMTRNILSRIVQSWRDLINTR